MEGKLHPHRNLGMSFCAVAVLTYVFFVTFAWYGEKSIVGYWPPWWFWAYPALCLSLPAMAFVSMNRYIRAKSIKARKGNTLDSVYANFFMQWQFLAPLCLDSPMARRANLSPYTMFVLAIGIPQIVFRRFRPSGRSGARDVTTPEFDEKAPPEAQRLRKASLAWAPLGSCFAKWIIVSACMVIIAYNGPENTPSPLLIWANDFGLIITLFNPMYPLMYTLRMKGLLTPLKYWRIWTGLDRLVQLGGCFLLLSFFWKNFVLKRAQDFPVKAFLLYFSFVFMGCYVNIRFPKFQDAALVLCFLAILLTEKFI